MVKNVRFIYSDCAEDLGPVTVGETVVVIPSTSSRAQMSDCIGEYVDALLRDLDLGSEENDEASCGTVNVDDEKREELKNRVRYLLSSTNGKGGGDGKCADCGESPCRVLRYGPDIMAATDTLPNTWDVRSHLYKAVTKARFGGEVTGIREPHPVCVVSAIRSLTPECD